MYGKREVVGVGGDGVWVQSVARECLCCVCCERANLRSSRYCRAYVETEWFVVCFGACRPKLLRIIAFVVAKQSS